MLSQTIALPEGPPMDGGAAGEGDGQTDKAADPITYMLSGLAECFRIAYGRSVVPADAMDLARR